MDLYAAVRRSVYVEGLSERAAARRFGLARETVRKMLRYRRPPGYRRAQPVRRPKLDAFTGIIDQILREDQCRPKKQRHTAKRIGERLRAEYGFTGGDTIVKAYVRAQRLGGQEMFVPLAHPPGDAQADFGEALVVIAGVECKAHDLVVDLPHSDDGFVQAFPAETTEAFCDGHNAAFGHFGGVPRRIVYDNTKLAVARILGDGTRQRTQVFCELQSHYLFADRFGRPGKGNDKGKVEGLVGYVRRNFFVPIPRCASWDALNADLAHKCGERRGRRLRRHTETIGERFARDREALLPLPPVPYDACDTRTTRVTSLSLVRYRRNDYSVPTAYGHREVLVKGYVDEVVIVCGSDGDRPPSSQRRAGSVDLRARGTTWPCWSARRGRSIKRRRWPGGSCRTSFSGCGACWRRGWASRARASTCRCCGCSKTFSSTTSAAPSGTPCVWGRSGSMPSSTSCGVASTTGRPTSIWRSIRTCRSPA